ncbi:MAG TPA: YciI family protein [Gemmatimonadales bacterium]|nr:YciI family protein [Gemmatimonadales bacterium]
MRFMVIVKANKDSEAGVMPSQEDLAGMGAFNEKLIEAGVMLAGEGLLASSKGSRVKFTGDKRTVTDGPFAESKELVAGFWIIKAASKADAIEWMKGAPFRNGEELEIRQIAEAEDFGAEFTPELQAQEDRHRVQAEANARR